MTKRFFYTIFVLALLFSASFLFPSKTYAYIDPGTGSYFTQFIVAILLGGAFGVKGYWSKIKKFFGKHDDKSKESKTSE